jgi:hypothetical protein
MAGMDFGLFMYIALCVAVCLMGLETIGYRCWRWSLDDMFKTLLVLSVMLALGRILALA